MMLKRKSRDPRKVINVGYGYVIQCIVEHMHPRFIPLKVSTSILTTVIRDMHISQVRACILWHIAANHIIRFLCLS